MRGQATFKRITRLGGRRAAEFDYNATGEGEYTGHATTDEADAACTGWISRRASCSSRRPTVPGQFTPAGEPIKIELKEDRTLNRQDSAGL